MDNSTPMVEYILKSLEQMQQQLKVIKQRHEEIQQQQKVIEQKLGEIQQQQKEIEQTFSLKIHNLEKKYNPSKE
jgi:prefoldin subunit 5